MSALAKNYGVFCFTAVLTVGIFIIDLALPLGIAGGALYIAPVLLASFALRRSFVLEIAVATSVFTLVGYHYSPDGGVAWMVLTNRLLSLAVIWVTAIIAFRRNKAVNDLRNSEARYRDLIDGSILAIQIVDTDGNWIYANQSCVDLFGFDSMDELLAVPRLGLVADHDMERVQNYRRAFFNDETPAKTYEYDGLRKDGSVIPIQVYLRRIVWNGQEVMSRIFTDLTDRKQTEEQLSISEKRLAGIIDIAPEAVISVDISGSIQLFNQGAEAIFGHSADDIIGQPLALLIPERFRDGHGQKIEGFLKVPETSRRMSQRSVLCGLRKDGTEFPAEASISKFVLDDEIVMTVLLRDITERKRAETIAWENEARLRLITDNVGANITYLDTDKRFRFINKNFEEVLGLPSGEIIGKSVSDIQGEERYRRDTPHIDEALGGKEVTFERSRTTADGVKRSYQSTYLPHFGEDGEVLGVYGLSVDITERVLAEEAMLTAKEEAELASRSKSEFIANMSHELRTPLNAINGFSELLAEEAFGPLGNEEYRKFSQAINDSGQHLLVLINDILDISKIEVGGAELSEETFDIMPIIDACITMIGERAADGGVELIDDISGATLPHLRADKTRIKQVVLNLLSNAVKFTEPGGQVTLKAWHNEDSGFVFQAIDTGVGIAADDIPKALARFQQVEGGLNRRHEGTGLGLPLAKSLVEQHGGSLDLQSQLGVGTTVTMRLPNNRTISKAA